MRELYLTEREFLVVKEALTARMAMLSAASNALRTAGHLEASQSTNKLLLQTQQIALNIAEAPIENHDG